MREKERKKRDRENARAANKTINKNKNRKKNEQQQYQNCRTGKKNELNEKNDIIAKSDYSDSARIG